MKLILTLLLISSAHAVEILHDGFEIKDEGVRVLNPRVAIDGEIRPLSLESRLPHICQELGFSEWTHSYFNRGYLGKMGCSSAALEDGLLRKIDHCSVELFSVTCN
jgi:hypothetical protein